MENMPIHDAYASQKMRLKRALASGFYFEAIVIEYAIFEDRSESALRHAGLKTTDSKGYPKSLNNKLNIINDSKQFQDSFSKKRLSRELIEQIRTWKEQRDDIIHKLMKMAPDIDKVEKVARDGNDLVILFDNKVKSVNNRHDKERKISENG